MSEIKLEKIGTQGHKINIGNVEIFFWNGEAHIFKAPGLDYVKTLSSPWTKFYSQAEKEFLNGFDPNEVNLMTGGIPFHALLAIAICHAWNNETAAEMNKEDLFTYQTEYELEYKHNFSYRKARAG